MTIMALGVVVLFQLGSMSAAAQDVERGEDVLTLLASIQRSVDQQESNTRVYISVQNPHYLERIELHNGRFEQNIEVLREMMSRVPGIDEKIDAFETAVENYRREVIIPETTLAADPATHAQAVAMVRDGVATRWMDPVDETLAELIEIQNQRLVEFKAHREAASTTATVALYVGVGLAVVLAILFGWLLTRAIARPVVAMTGAMRKLAGGDNSIEVPGVGRKDELGQMAGAVLTFKEAAIEKLRLEAEAAEQRRLAEEERARNEAEKAREAEEDRIAIEALGRGLSAMANGDLTHRFTAEVAPKAQQLKTDFNAAIAQLQDAMAKIGRA